MGFSLTKEQQAAVENRGGGLLVSAAAGAGKTRVLVQRLLRRVTEERLDIDQFLVITFTKAAAAELRGRIVAELAAQLATHPTDRHLRRQTTLVYKTQISTIDAFCGNLLRQWGYTLDLDPDFRLCDEHEAGILRLRAVEDVLEARYETITPDGDFAALLDVMNNRRDDSKLAEIVLDMHGRVQSHPNPAAWLAQQLEGFRVSPETRAEDTAWGCLILDAVHEKAAYWRAQMECALELAEEDAKILAAYGSSISETRDALGTLAAAALCGWDETVGASNVPFPRLGSVRKCENPRAKDTVKKLRDTCAKRIAKVNEWLAGTSAELMADTAAALPAMGALFDLVKDFSAQYAALKRQKNVLDFSDLEHFAVQLLWDETGTTTLASVQEKAFTEVMVDEFQDTNEVQNAIFNAITGGGKSLFMVGDVKQSVYRFRLADPTIFLEKYRTFAPYEAASDGRPRRISLQHNFRSRAQVLEGANFLFRNLMSRRMGEMEYAQDEALYAGGTFAGDEADYAVELAALDCSNKGEDERNEVGKDLQEARFAAARIRQMLDEKFPVSDGVGALRALRATDVVILLRSPGPVLRFYQQALAEQEIPWSSQAQDSFFDATEVAVALSFLRLADNPRQDVPLLSVLRSPVFAFSAERLALLRAGVPEGDFYSAMVEDGGADCVAVLTLLAELRERAAEMSCHQLLWEIYDRTNLVGLFSVSGNGADRREHLLALADAARAYEAGGHKGLFSFITYLHRLQEQGKSPQGAGVEGSDGVQILSIHRSKGLEFSVVLLCGLTRQFNTSDLKLPVLFHPKLGVGPQILDTERMISYPTLARQAVAQALQTEMLSEELRLLYVAVTRAVDKLILCCALTNGAKDLENLAPFAQCPAPAEALLTARSMGQWVLLVALARAEAQELRAQVDADFTLTTAPCGPVWDIRWMAAAPLEVPQARTQFVEAQGKGDPAEDAALFAALEWAYPQSGDVTIPSKLTATQMKTRAAEEVFTSLTPREEPLTGEVFAAFVPTDEPLEKGAAGAGFARTAPQLGAAHPSAEEKSGWQDGKKTRVKPLRQLDFLEMNAPLTGAQRGIALHLVMQFIDFAKTGSVAAVAEEIARLSALQIITPQQAQAADPTKIATFFDSPLGRELMASGTMHREFRFSILCPAAEYYPAASAGEEVLLQGVVDCWFETEAGITLLDFKSDNVRREGLSARSETYRPQLDAYAAALSRITGKAVRRRVLWFFSCDCAAELGA